MKFFDIAANLADHQFQGVYYHKKAHESDLDSVIERAKSIGVKGMLIVGGHAQDTIDSYEICQRSKNFYTTVGLHPCHANRVAKEGGQAAYFQVLEDLIVKYRPKVVAVGECGLDYDRLDYSKKEEQLLQFPPHFALAEKFDLPMYLHNRNTAGDFVKLVKENRHRFPGGVVHSFTDSLEELKECLAMGLYIGVNGCSMKTEANLEVVKQIPLDRIMIETDAPYCEIRNTSPASKLYTTKFEAAAKEKFNKTKMVKGRNEPCKIKQVSEAVAKVLGIPEAELARHAYENTLKLLNITEQSD